MRRREYERLEKLHREMWSWCAETGLHKKDWPGWQRKGMNYIPNHCFACAAREGSLNCSLCPIAWVKNSEGAKYACEWPSSLYGKWITSYEQGNIAMIKKYAAKIAKMAWRPYESLRKSQHLQYEIPY